jgi:hypothetical protein
MRISAPLSVLLATQLAIAKAMNKGCEQCSDQHTAIKKHCHQKTLPSKNSRIDGIQESEEFQ